MNIKITGKLALALATGVTALMIFVPQAEAQYRFRHWNGGSYGEGRGGGGWNGGYRGWNNGHYGGGWNNGGAAVAGLAIGALTGAIIAGNAYPSYGYGYGGYAPPVMVMAGMRPPVMVMAGMRLPNMAMRGMRTPTIVPAAMIATQGKRTTRRRGCNIAMPCRRQHTIDPLWGRTVMRAISPFIGFRTASDTTCSSRIGRRKAAALFHERVRSQA